MSEKTLDDILWYLADDDSVSLKNIEDAKAAILQRIREVMPGDRKITPDPRFEWVEGWNAYRTEMLKRLEQLRHR